MSLLGALTPLGKVAQKRSLWLRCALAYTVAGSCSAALVGGLLGAVGRWLPHGAYPEVIFSAVILLTLVLAAREWGWLKFNLPERTRQTESTFAHEFGYVVGSAMWGFHIGLGFATRITFGGFWMLVAVSVALGEPLYCAVLMVGYWLGRALSVWVAPLLWRDYDPVRITNEVENANPLFHRLVGFALVWSALIVLGLVL